MCNITLENVQFTNAWKQIVLPGTNRKHCFSGGISDIINGIKSSFLVKCIYLTIRPGPEVIKLFSCSTQLSINFFQLINVKMPTIVGILTIMCRQNSILVLSEPEKC